MKKLLALLAVLGMVNVASAALTLQVVKSATAADLGGVLCDTYTVSVVVTDGSKFISVDGRFTGLNGTGMLNYVSYWDFYYDPTLAEIPGTYHPVITETFDGAAAAKKGTLVKQPKTSLIYLNGYNEDEEKVVEMITYDFGSIEEEATGYLSASKFNAAYAFKNIVTTGTVPLFQIVFPQGENAGVSAVIQLGDDKGVISFSDSLVLGVPEPATMGLLAIGALGLIRRKRA